MRDVPDVLLERIRRLDALLRHYYGQVGGQGRLLAALREAPEISQKELTERLGLRKQSLGELLGKLEHKGFVTREPAAEDRRAMNIRLTAAGRAAAQRLEERDRARRDIFAVLDEGEREQFGYLAEVLIAALEEELGPEWEPPRHRHHHGEHREDGRLPGEESRTG